MAALLVLLVGAQVTGRSSKWLIDLAWTGASLTATIASWRTSRQLAGIRRIAWSLFAAACASWLFGQLVWDWQELVRGINVRFPSAADYGFTGYSVLFTLGLLFLGRTQSARRVAPQRLANLGLILCSLAVVVNRMVFAPLSQSAHTDYFTAFALIENLGVTATFIVAVYLLWSYRWGVHLRPMFLIVFSLALHALCALIYAHHLFLNAYSATRFIDVGWVAVFGLMHWAAVEQRHVESRGAPSRALYQGEGWVEALMPALLLLLIASTTAVSLGSPPVQTKTTNAILLGVFAIILAFRETWMYSRGLQLEERLEQVHTSLSSAREELQRTAEERIEAERHMELAARAGGVGLWDWDFKTRQVRYSREWKAQLGYAEHEISNSAEEWRTRLHPDDAEPAIRALMHFLADPSGEFSIEARMQHRDGSFRWILSRATVLRDETGAPQRMLGSHIDITARKKMEMALRESEARYRELADDLEQRVAQRTADLSEAYRESQSFAYAVAHDLKAPLRAIDGFSHLLRESTAARLSEREREYVERVRRGAMHMASLIEGLLAYSRMEHYEVHLADVELRAFVDELVAQLPERTRMPEVQLVVVVPTLRVYADREGLRVVLRNLIENAFKFTRGVPHPRVEIGARREQGSALLWVTDNGIGFDQAYHDQIFEIFQRLHRSEEFEGTGIGLALARKAMQRMRGRIWAKSSPGRGATFYVELALFDAREEKERHDGDRTAA